MSLTGNKKWNLHLLEQMEVGVHCVQVNLQKGIGVTAHHAFVVSIVEQHKHCVSKEEEIDMLEDNRGVGGCFQKKDVNIATTLQSGEGILN